MRIGERGGCETAGGLVPTRWTRTDVYFLIGLKRLLVGDLVITPVASDNLVNRWRLGALTDPFSSISKKERERKWIWIMWT